MANNKLVSEIIRQRIIEDNGQFFANDNIADYIQDGELELLKAELESKFSGVLDTLVIDTTHDHNTQETAKRLAKMYIEEVFSGRYNKKPSITEFPNYKNLQQIYTLGPITIRSACSHHLVPITGEVYIGIIPSDKVIGISKFARLTNWVMNRPHIQEEAVIMLADEIEKAVQPLGIAIMLSATHMCMTWRGVKDNDVKMNNIFYRGVFETDTRLQQQFMQVIKI